ncbi:MAG: DJ-1/PfpI family protein [Gammaproteobacteria bacterium]|nr:DJ-1/PfpI family protein [Gammaproteobacteria bacterium]
MKPVYILVHEDVVLSSAAAPLDILTRTNDILRTAGKPPAFDVALVGRRSDRVALALPAAFDCQRTLDEALPGPHGHRRPLIPVPAFSGDWEFVRDRNHAAIEWLGRHHRAGTEIASLCVGSYFLAQAGLLDGKPCTSHWAAVEDMRRRFPHIAIEPDSVLTDQDGIYTGGGAFSSLNMVLYPVEKFCGHDIGVRVAKNFSIHRDHVNQAHFSVFNGLTRHGDKVILDAQDYIESHYTEAISVAGVAGRVNMSKRNFVRRFKRAVRSRRLNISSE